MYYVKKPEISDPHQCSDNMPNKLKRSPKSTGPSIWTQLQPNMKGSVQIIVLVMYITL